MEHPPYPAVIARPGVDPGHVREWTGFPAAHRPRGSDPQEGAHLWGCLTMCGLVCTPSVGIAFPEGGAVLGLLTVIGIWMSVWTRRKPLQDRRVPLRPGQDYLQGPGDGSLEDLLFDQLYEAVHVVHRVSDRETEVDGVRVRVIVDDVAWTLARRLTSVHGLRAEAQRLEAQGGTESVRAAEDACERLDRVLLVVSQRVQAVERAGAALRDVDNYGSIQRLRRGLSEVEATLAESDQEEDSMGMVTDAVKAAHELVKVRDSLAQEG